MSVSATRFDMHVHSDFSDGRMSVRQIEETALSKNIGVCIADHNEIRGSIILLNQNRIPTIPALETGSKERLEFLMYFRDPGNLEQYFIHYVEPYKRKRYFSKLKLSFLDLIPAAKECGALVCLPHPFAPTWKGIDFNKSRKAKLLDPDFLRQIDLVEVINGHLTDSRNFKAFLFSELFDKSVLAGSDAHIPSEIGSVYLQFPEPKSGPDVFEILGSPIKVGKAKPFSPAGFMRTSRKVAISHIKLFTSRKDQKAWMIKYDNGKS